MAIQTGMGFSSLVGLSRGLTDPIACWSAHGAARYGMTQRPCRVPHMFSYMRLAEGLDALALRRGHPDDEAELSIDLGHTVFCDPAATVTLAALAATAERATRRSVELRSWDPGGYLSRVGLKQFAGHRDDFPRKRLVSDRLTSITEVRDAQGRQRARSDVLNVLDVQHAGARMVLDYCLEEILRNVEDHANSPVNALLQAQYYDNRHEVVMAIADTGRGVLSSLRTRHDVGSHEEALKAALRPGVSGRNTRKGTNAGLGLTVSSELVTQVGGIFQLASGDCVLEVRKSGQTAYALRETDWPGLIVVMVVPRDDNLNWEGTFTRVMEQV